MKRNLNTFQIILALLVLSLFGTQNALGQSSQAQTKISGLNIPQYYLVEHFFNIAHTFCEDASGQEALFKLIDVKKGSPAAHAVMTAIQQARLLATEGRQAMVQVHDVPNGQEKVETFRNAKATSQANLPGAPEKKARALAEIYHTLQSTLIAEGLGIGGIEQFIRKYIASGSHRTTKETIAELDPLTIAFKSRLEELGN